MWVFVLGKVFAAMHRWQCHRSAVEEKIFHRSSAELAERQGAGTPRDATGAKRR
jgi:hypothetical protein